MEISTHIQIDGGAMAAQMECQRYAHGFAREAMRTMDPAHRERCLMQSRDYAALAELIAAARRFNAAGAR